MGGTTFDGSDSQPFEWVSVLNPTVEQDDEVGVAGFAVAVETSAHDSRSRTRSAGDFEFAIVPDAAYTNLLAPSNRPPAIPKYGLAESARPSPRSAQPGCPSMAISP